MTGLLEGKVCLVTGAGRGIGRSIAETFLKEGATVYCNATSDASLTWTLELKEERLKSLPFDIRDPEKCRQAVQTIRREEKKLDILVNNAGVEYDELIGFFDREHRDEMFAVNVFAPMELIQLSARVMQRSRSGSIINIVSKVGIYGNPGQLVYSSTKGAMVAVTKSAAKELAPLGIRVNAVAPGLTETDMIQETAEDFLKGRIQNIGMGRLAQPLDIANTCLFLASDLSTYMTGQVLEVEGSTIM